MYDLNLDQTNTARFLFGEEEVGSLPRGQTPDDNFPTLVRREEHMVSAVGRSLTCFETASPRSASFAAKVVR